MYTMLHSGLCGVRRPCLIGHASRKSTYIHSKSMRCAAYASNQSPVPALALIALLTCAGPAVALGSASTILDELTVPSAAPEVMAPPASLEQLPKVSPPGGDQRQPASREGGQTSDSATPGEAATPPPPKRRLSRLQELQQARDDLKAKQQELLKKTDELKEKEQTIAILQEELDIERVLRALLENDKDKAEEIAKLAMGLCSGAMIPP